ncbi:cyclic nucleotide-binding domain-containing protein [Clostridium sp. B9]|uniref:cyclic nucleotide-binding domain-containing protein n=1 Tax=Clostridium sp. B9 TaxID=3423224 RepID=UPI003D2EB11B
MIKIKNKEKLYELIHKHSLKSIFSEDLLPKLELHMFKKNEHICSMGEELKYFYFFVEGSAKVYKTLPNGKSTLIKFYEPVQLVGDIEIINKINANCSVQALKSSICIAIPINTVNSIALNDSNFLMYITKSLADKLASQSINSSITIVYPLETKLATYLLKVNNKNVVLIPNYSNLADLLGASYRHLNRVLNKLSEKEIIVKDKNCIKILNKKELKTLSGDLYK